MTFKVLKISIGLAIAIFVVVKLYCCRGIKAPAPYGIHGEYSLVSTPTYTANGVEKDSLLKLLTKENLIVKNGRVNDYDPPWDSLRYLVANIPCDEEKIEAYIEFKDKRARNTTFQVLWFNAEPTRDNKEYEKRAEKYFKCFESLLRKNQLIK